MFVFKLKIRKFVLSYNLKFFTTNVQAIPLVKVGWLFALRMCQGVAFSGDCLYL